MLRDILFALITIIVGVTLVPLVADATYDTTCNWNGSECLATNVTGASSAIIGLVPLFFIIGLLLVTIQSTLSGLSKMGF